MTLRINYFNTIVKISAIAVIFIPNIVFALSDDEQRAIDQNIQNEQRLQRERQNIIQQKEIEELENIGKTKSKEIESNLDKSFKDDGRCKLIDKITIENSKTISSKKLHKKFIKKHLDKCLTKSDIKNIGDDITNFYLEKGYISARIYFKTKEISKGILKIFIEEGNLEDIEFNDNSKLNDKLFYRRKGQNFFAFPFLKKKALNLRDIEQGLDQINRLSSNNAIMSIEAGDEVGGSKVIINNKVGHLTNITLSQDNSGSVSTGKYRNKITINQDNLFGLNDNIYINSSSTNNNDKNNKYSKSTYLAFSVPFGYYTLGGNYSHSKYLITTIGSVNDFKSSGNTESKTFYIDRVLNRGKKHKISLKADLERIDSDNYIEDAFIDVNSRRLTSINIYLNNTVYTKKASIYIQPSYHRGLEALDSLKDISGLAKKDPKAQYEYFGIYGYVNHNFKIPKTNIPFNHLLTFDIQHAKDSLFSTKQFSIGGRYTVRGFDESQVSGDSGYYIRNDFKINSSYLIPEKLKKSKIFSHNISKDLLINNILSKTDFSIFYDYGYTRSRVIDERSDEGYMSGIGAKINYKGKYLNWDLTYSKSLHSPQFLRNIDSIDKDNESIYFNVSFKYSLF